MREVCEEHDKRATGGKQALGTNTGKEVDAEQDRNTREAGKENQEKG